MANGEADFAIFIWRGGEGFFMDTKKWRLWCHTLEPGACAWIGMREEVCLT